MGAKNFTAGLALAFCVASSASHATVLTGDAVHAIDGYDGYVDAFDQASVNFVSGADVSWLSMYGQSNLNFFGGEASWVRMHDNSSARILGGTVSWLVMLDRSTADIYKSTISWLVLDDVSRVDIYGSDFAYSGGHLSGNWADGTPFSFWALNGDAQGIPTGFGSSWMPENIYLHAVPAPATSYLIILALPLLALFRNGFAKRSLPA